MITGTTGQFLELLGFRSIRGNRRAVQARGIWRRNGRWGRSNINNQDIYIYITERARHPEDKKERNKERKDNRILIEIKESDKTARPEAKGRNLCAKAAGRRKRKKDQDD